MQVSYSLPIYFEQLLAVVQQCSIEEKLQLLDFLEKETARVRLARSIQIIADRNIANDRMPEAEILSEVSAVRQQQYEQREISH